MNAGLTIHYICAKLNAKSPNCSVMFNVLLVAWTSKHFCSIHSKKVNEISEHKFRISFHLFSNAENFHPSVYGHRSILASLQMYQSIICTMNKTHKQWTHELNAPEDNQEKKKKNRWAKIDCLHMFGVYCSRTVNWFFLSLILTFRTVLKCVLSHWNFNWFRTFTQYSR